MSQINNTKHGKNRGLEVLLYKQGGKKKEEPVSYKFNLKKIISIFNREFGFQVDFYIKNKTNSQETGKC